MPAAVPELDDRGTPTASVAWGSEPLFDDVEALAFVLDQMPVGVALIGASGRVTWMNEPARVLIARGEGIALRDGRLEATARGDAAALAGLIERAVASGAAVPREPETLALERSAAPSRVVVVARAVQRSVAPRTRSAARAVVFLSDAEHDLRASRKRLRALFGLRSADANLVALLAAGHSLRAAASLLGITPESARTYLKRIFEKTGTRRQSELVRLALSVAAAGAADP